MADSDKNKKNSDPLLWNPTVGRDKSTLNKMENYKTLSYPIDLGTNRYPYFMIFYINANTKSALVKNDGTAKDKLTTDVNPYESSIGNAMSAITQTSGGKGITNLQEKAGVQVIASKKRLSIALALPIPNDVNFVHSTSYKTASGGGFLGTALRDVLNEEYGKAGKAFIDSAVQGLPTTAVKHLGKALDENFNVADFDAIKNKILGWAKNDRKEQVFESANSRSFRFSWLLIPKTPQESTDIKDIIKWFKYNQYPEIDESSGGLNVIIPNEFDIEFHFQNSGKIKEMEGISKISTCVLEDVDVNYAALGKFVAFEGTDNPTAIQLTMTFREVEPLTRKHIEMGY